jgi:polyhydroxybutyrate depolymerase
VIRAALISLLLCSAARAEDVSLTVSGRPFLAHLPAHGGKGPAPLVLLLHPYTGSGTSMIDQLEVRPHSDAHGYYVAAPEGRPLQPGSTWHFWNASAACCDFIRSGVDDVAYLRAVIQTMLDRYPIDHRRVFVFGFSNGGFMAHRLACELPSLVAGIASVAGAGPGRCAATTPVTILEIHGDADDVVPIAGGLLGGDLPKIASFPPLRRTMEEWAQRDGCKAPRAMPPLELDARVPGPETSVERWTNCRAGAGVELWTSAHGKHMPYSAALLFQQAFDMLLRHPRQ